MSKKISFFLQVFIGTSIAIVLLYFVFRNIEWVDFWQRAKKTNYSWVFFSIAISLATFIVRAYRWNILLEPLGFKLKTSRTTLAVIIGYLANMALPRLGEITRCGVLNKNDKVPIPEAIGSVVTERIMDALTLLLLILISLIIESKRLVTFLHTAYKDFQIPSYFFLILLGVISIGTLVVVLFIRKKNKVKGGFMNYLNRFIAGLLSLKDIKKPVGFIVSTVILWVLYYLMSYVIVFSLDETAHLSLSAGLMLLITGGIALTIPVQNGFGTYHTMIAGMLVLYSIDKTTGVFLATLLHTSQIIAVAIFGSIALLISATIKKNMTN